MINQLDATTSFYVCNGISFHSKIQACIYSQTVNQPVKWIFGLDDVFSKYPWHIEPSETLDELYDRRARELREQYDYIVLSYSGGADSHNALMSFYRQGLHVDEILTNHLTKATESYMDFSGKDKRAENFAAEHQLNAVAKLQWIKTNMPNTVITEMDVSDSVLHALDGKDESWVLDRKEYLSIGSLFRVNYFYFKAFKNRLDTGKKIGFVIGLEKPRTFIENDTLVLAFADTVLCNASPSEYNVDYDNVTIEPFYWARTTAPLICKQAHVIKRFIQGSGALRYYWDSSQGFSYKVSRTMHERWLRTLLYTTWDNSWYQADKSQYTWNNEFDDWWRKETKGTEQELIWKRGLDHIHKNAKDYIVYRNGKPDGFKPFTVKYSICKMPPTPN